MKTKILLVLVGGAICAAAVGFTLRAIHAKAEANKTLAVLGETRAMLAAELRAAEARIASIEKDRGALQAALDSMRASPPASASATAAIVTPSTVAPVATRGGAPGAMPTAVVPLANSRDMLMQDPQVQALWLKMTRAQLARDFGPFYAALNLSPAQIENFEAAMIKWREQSLDLSAVAQSQGASAESTVSVLRRRAYLDAQASFREILGSEGHRELQAYERTRDVRTVIKDVAAAALIEGQPLTTVQADQLIRTIAQTTKASISDGSADVRTVNWEMVDAQAQQFLTPAQFALFKRGARRAELQLDVAIGRAQQAEAAAAAAKARGSSGE